MVQASTFVLAAFAIAPVFAAPLNPASAEGSFKRSDDSASLVQRSSIDIISGESSSLAARAPEPKFSFGRLLRGGAKVASLLIRDEDGNVYERELNDDIDARSPKFSFGRLLRGGAKVASLLIRDEDGSVYERELNDIDARSPKFSFGRLLRGGAKVASLLIRDEDGSVYERDLEDLELDTRSPSPAPKFSFGRILRGGAKVASLLIRDEDGNVFERELDLDDLSDRDFEDVELDTRAPEPKFSFGRLLRGGAKVASLLIRDEDGNVFERELDLEGLSERDIQELAEELQARDFVFDFEDSLEAREPRVRVGRALNKASTAARKASGAVGRVGQQVGNARNIIGSAAGFVNKVSDFASGLGLREEEEGIEAREIDELD